MIFQKILNKTYFFPLLICVLSLFLLFGIVLSKYNHVAYYDWDLAFFTQACWQLLHGSQYVSLVGINYFGDHSYFITFLILPIFALIPHPLTLIFLKILSLVLAAFIFYRIIYLKLGFKTALVLMAMYIFFPANIFSIIYEFNPECFAPPLLFWMYLAFDKNRWKQFFISSLLLMLIKENMALMVMMFGLYGLFIPQKSKIKCLSIIFISLFVFLILSFYVIPYFRQMHEHAFIVRYAYLGSNLREIILNVFKHPLEIGKIVIDPVNLQYIHNLFSMFLVPALLSPHLLMPILPILLQHFLSTSIQEHTIFYHYGATMVPFIFLASVSTLTFLKTRFNKRIFGALLCLLILFLFIHWYKNQDALFKRINIHRDTFIAERWSMIQSIPSDAPVIATFDFLAPLSLREQVYAFHKIYDQSYQEPGQMKLSELNIFKPFKLPDEVKYALIDFNDPWLRQGAQHLKARQRIDVFLKAYSWKIVRSFGSIVLLKRQ